MSVRRRIVRERVKRQRVFRKGMDDMGIALNHIRDVIAKLRAEGRTHISPEEFAQLLAKGEQP